MKQENKEGPTVLGTLPQPARVDVDVFVKKGTQKKSVIAHSRLRAEKDSLPAGKTLIVYCRSGARAAAASAMLNRAGFDVLYVDDHIDNWKSKIAG